MTNIDCINFSHPKVKALVDAIGKEKTIELFIEHDFSFPDNISPYLINDPVFEGVQSEEEVIDMPVCVERQIADKAALALTQKHPNYTFSVMGDEDTGYTVYKELKAKSVSSNIIEIMSRKMGVNYMYVSSQDLITLGASQGATSFVKDKTVYLVKGKVNDVVAIEEFLHPFVRELQINNETVFYGLLQEASTIPEFIALRKEIDDKYGKIKGYDVDNELVTQILSHKVLKNFADNGMNELPVEKVHRFVSALDKVVNYIANSIMNLLKEAGILIPIPAKFLKNFSTIRSMSALIATEGVKFETASIKEGLMHLSDVQRQTIDMFDDLESKTSTVDNNYIVEGAANKWDRPSQLAKPKSFGEDIQSEEGENMKAAGNRFHEFMGSIIARAFPEANKHIKPITLTIKEVKFYDELKEFLKFHVIQPAIQEGAVIRAETFVANEMLNIAGRVDILKISKDGSYDVYDLKTRYRKETKGKARFHKIMEWTKQTGFYKQLLSTPNSVGTPIGKVNSVRIIELEGTQFESEIKGIRGIGMVSPKEEKTGIDRLDDFIHKLYNQIEILKSKTPRNEVQKIAHDKLISSKIELAQTLQLQQEYSEILNHAKEELFILDDLIESGNIDKDTETILSDLKIFSVLSQFIDETKLNKEEIAQLYNIQGRAVSLHSKFLSLWSNTLSDKSRGVGVLGNLTQDLFGAGKDIDKWVKNITGVASLDSPLAQTAFRLVNEKIERGRAKSMIAFEKISEAVSNLKAQLGKLDYSIFVNSTDKNNYLVDKYKYEYFDEAKKHRNDVDWFRENATFDKEKYEKQYQYQIDYLNRFEKSKKREIEAIAVEKGIENVPAYVETAYKNYRKQELQRWVTKNKSITEFNIPKNQWIDPKWRAIKEGQYKGTAVEAFYDLYKNFLDESRDIAPEWLSPRFIPNFSASFVEKVARMGLIKGAGDSYTKLLTGLDSSFDLDYGLQDSFSGEAFRKLSIPGLNNKVDTQSLDLGLSMQMFMEGVYKYQELSDVEETVNITKHFMRSGKILKADFRGNTTEVSAIQSQMADVFDNYVDAVLYGIKKDDYGKLELTGGKGIGGKVATLTGLLKKDDKVMISWSKIVDKLLGYVSLKNLSFNVFSPITNLLGGTGQLFATGAGGKYYNAEELAKAITIVSGGEMTEHGKLASKIFEWIELNSTDVKFRNNKLSSYQTDKILEKYNGMSGMRLSEEVLYKSGVLAMLKSEKHRLKMSDFSMVNGKLVIKNEDILNKSLFKAKANAVMGSAFGAMTDNDYILANKTIIGRMLIQHRSWIPKMYFERFGRKQTNYVLEEEVEGRFRTLYRTILHLWTKQQRAALTDLEKYNLKTASMEIGLYVAIGLLIKALAAGTDDDDKKEEWYKFAMLVGHRTTAELGFFMDPEATSQILLHPAASISLIDDYSRLVKNLWKESTGDAKERKAAKPLKSLGKVIPWVGQWQRFVDELFNINLSSD